MRGGTSAHHACWGVPTAASRPTSAAPAAASRLLTSFSSRIPLSSLWSQEAAGIIIPLHRRATEARAQGLLMATCLRPSQCHEHSRGSGKPCRENKQKDPLKCLQSRGCVGSQAMHGPL